VMLHLSGTVCVEMELLIRAIGNEKLDTFQGVLSKASSTEFLVSQAKLRIGRSVKVQLTY